MRTVAASSAPASPLPNPALLDQGPRCAHPGGACPRALRAAPPTANYLSSTRFEFVTTARLREVHLTSFKSFTGAILPVEDLTILTGRNSSGKSNALDAIEVLSRLATGEDLADALDGRRREAGPVRGGSQGCAPHGSGSFRLGCTVEKDNALFHYLVEIEVLPELRIIGEWLRGPAPAVRSKRVLQRELLHTREPHRGNAGLVAEIYNGKTGSNKLVTFRDNRLLLTQLPLRWSPMNDAEMGVTTAAEAVLEALTGVFHLDPVPHLMREYVTERDSDLRRTGENLSAAIHKLAETDPGNFSRITRLVQEVADERVSAIEMRRSDLGDVMLALREGPSKQAVTPAREMSDGLLRFIAIATALLTPKQDLDINQTLTTLPSITPEHSVTIIIEELENGLHPSQAGRMLRLINDATSAPGTSVIITTHSPALLNQITGQLNGGVVVCYRDTDSGSSQLEQLTELEGYAEAMASGRLGDVVSEGRLVRPESRKANYDALLQKLGLE